MGIPAAVVVAALALPAGLSWAAAASSAPVERTPPAGSAVRSGLPSAGAVTSLPEPPRPPGPRDLTTGAPANQPAADTSPSAGQTAPRHAGQVWVWPVSGKLGRRFDPPRVRWGSGHRGVDLEVGVGSAVRAPAAGTVTFAGLVAGREILVVTSAGGLRSTFEPVAAAVPLGTAVAAGDVVGTLTAAPGHCAPATCLHWGVLAGTEYLDPLGFVRPPVVLLPVG